VETNRWNKCAYRWGRERWQ